MIYLVDFFCLERNVMVVLFLRMLIDGVLLFGIKMIFGVEVVVLNVVFVMIVVLELVGLVLGRCVIIFVVVLGICESGCRVLIRLRVVKLG